MPGVDGARFVLVTNRGGDRRNPDLAVTIIEALDLALGVLALLRRSCRFHFQLSSPFLGVSEGSYLATDWGRITQQIVFYRGILRVQSSIRAA